LTKVIASSRLCSKILTLANICHRRIDAERRATSVNITFEPVGWNRV